MFQAQRVDIIRNIIWLGLVCIFLEPAGHFLYKIHNGQFEICDLGKSLKESDKESEKEKEKETDPVHASSLGNYFPKPSPSHSGMYQRANKKTFLPDIPSPPPWELYPS